MPYKPILYTCLDCGKEIFTKNKIRTDVCKSCNAMRNIRSIQKLGIAGRRLRPFEYAYNSLLRNAQKMRREVKITYDEYLDFTLIKECHYCQNTIPWSEFTTKGKKNCNYFLDRKDNSIDYQIENLVVCCPKCNRIKSNEFTYEEFLELIHFIKKMRAQ